MTVVINQEWVSLNVPFVFDMWALNSILWCCLLSALIAKLSVSIAKQQILQPDAKTSLLSICQANTWYFRGHKLLQLSRVHLMQCLLVGTNGHTLMGECWEGICILIDVRHNQSRAMAGPKLGARDEKLRLTCSNPSLILLWPMAHCDLRMFSDIAGAVFYFSVSRISVFDSFWGLRW